MQRGNGAVLGKANTPTASVASGVWALNEVQRAVLAGIWPVTAQPDPYFEYVTMLLHGDGTNGGQNNTFLDSSSNNFSITRNGNTTQGSFSPYGDLWSNYFDGSGDYLSIADNAALDISGDFTIEFWANVDSGNVDRAGIIGHRDQSTFTDGTDWVIRVETSAGKIGFGYDSSGNYYDMGSYVVGEWAHYAITRSGTTIRTFKNGTQVATATSSSTWSSTAAFLIGRNISGFDYKGFLSNVRLVKGTAVYTSAFTPSTAPLTAITNTSLLTCQSNRFIDNSSNNFTITRNGDVRVTNFAPFAPSAAYSTAVNGGSGYFDGSGDYLTTAQSANLAIGTSDFCIEYWVYSLNTNEITPFGQWASGNADWILQYRTGPDQFRFYYNSSNDLSGNYTMVPNQWTHVAVCRSGSTMSLYVNGTRLATKTDTTSINNGRGLTIGVNPDGPIQQTNGYITDTRIVVGSSVYTPSSSTLTVPTAPLTAISNTKFLCGFTNAAIFDNSMKADLETVGNAQISTSVKKFGTGSMAFDRSGDWLAAAPSVNFAMGTGDFTIEGWVYFAGANANGNGILQITNGYLNSTETGPAIGVDNGSGYWAVYTTNSGSGVSTTTPSVNTWYHFAMVRYSGTTKLYINGSSVYSVADSNNYQNQYLTVGGWYNSSYLLNGYIDDLRITKGVARYTANFTPPTAPFPDF